MSDPTNTPLVPPVRPLNFIEQIVKQDNAALKWGAWADPVDAGIPGVLDHGKEKAAIKGPARRIGKPRVHTRFPPEPNGWLHIGHAKSILLNAGLAAKYDGKFNLRFDDTNPTKEEMEYVEAIKRDVKWLGADYENPDWSGAGDGDGGGGGGGGIFWASDYFDHMYEFAKELILKGHAYVCELSGEEVSKRRGTPSIPATSPFRDRPAAESMKLFREMKLGKHADGSMTLRAKIDLASPNFNLRDPMMYRIMHAPHHNTGTKWCIYPMYDWAHGIEDSLEGVTHSICTLEFENHRPLYDWFINAINEGRSPEDHLNRPIWHSQQIEFAKLIPTYTILSKRNLLKLVQDRTVSGWDDPRMPTIAGVRRRGYTPVALRAFCDDLGATKTESLIDFGRLENAVRDHLNKVAPRYMAVLRPLKLIIDNYPQGQTELLDCVNNPEDPGAGSRKVPFSRELFIERDDFMESPPNPKKFFRLTPGQEVRFRWAYFLKCVDCDKDAAGNVTAVHCTYDPATKGGDCPPGPNGEPPRKVKGTIHWVSAAHAVKAEVRLFDRLFKAEEPGKSGGAIGNFMDDFNANSLEVIEAHLEPALDALKYASDCADGFTPGAFRTPRVQFERLGYFTLDPDSTGTKQVWNRTVTLKDAWAKEAAKI